MLEINNTTRQKINLKKTAAIVAEFLRVYHKINWTVSLAIVGDAAIKKINRHYRGVDRATDVLSFNGGSSPTAVGKKRLADKYLGEIIINIQEANRVKKYAELWQEIGYVEKPKAEQIFYFLVVHGLLHLIGDNDETEPGRQEMLRQGKFFLEML